MQQLQLHKSGIMTTKNHLNHLKLALIAAAISLPATAQAGGHPRYRLIDLGTLGGPSSSVAGGTDITNQKGILIGSADTADPDPSSPNCYSPTCSARHAFEWQNGTVTDLGTLPGAVISDAICINAHGDIAGLSENGLIDPLTGLPEVFGVLWKNGKIINLGALGGNGSIALGLNNDGEITGAAANAIPDPFSLSPILGGPVLATQTRAFLWRQEVMYDLGTLGGPDSFGLFVNNHGEVAGVSYTDGTPNDSTGLPTLHPFLWENGKMLDLGSLGGAFSVVNGLNDRGNVVGFMTLSGDQFQHPYLWNHGTLIDLGTLGGSNGEAHGINDAGEVVGVADLPGGSHNAFLWKEGAMTDLGNLGITSDAHEINSKGQVVGASRISFQGTEASAFLWEKGGPMIDLNTLIPANSPLHVVFAEHINDRGEIAGTGLPPGVPLADIDTRGHAFLLIPVGRE
jgi:probable HAF family extracellular repeat protein